MVTVELEKVTLISLKGSNSERPLLLSFKMILKSSILLKGAFLY